MSGTKPDEALPDRNGDKPAPADATHTKGGAPTDQAHEDVGDGTLSGSIPAGLGSKELRDIAESEKDSSSGTG